MTANRAGLSDLTQRVLASIPPLWINNEAVESRSGSALIDVNPSTKEPIATIAVAGTGDVDAAVHSARQALREGPWVAMSPKNREWVLWRLANLMDEHRQELAELDSIDMGMPIRQALHGTIPMAIDHMRYMAGWATKLTGDTIPTSQGQYLNYTVREPVGVVAAIVPWNFPLLMAVWKLGAALAAGCTVVLKPAEQSPLSALYLAQLVAQAGLPPGVFNVVTGDGTTGALLVKHSGIDKVAFTGSTAVGQDIMRSAANHMTRVSLELGGKAPNIIFPDADLDAAVSGATNGIFMNQGEVCAAGSRIFVHRAIYERVLEELVKATGKLRLGNALDPSTRVGPVVSREQFDRVVSYIQGAHRDGATLVAGGETEDQTGYFITPTIFRDVQDDMVIAREEIFGPVAAVLPFDTEADVIERANRSWSGLSAGVWTRDIARAHRVAHALDVGTVWVNSYHVYDAAAPWGGRKMSGFGREMGRDALDLYTEVKDIWVALGH